MERPLMEKRRSSSRTSIRSLNPDILATIFSNLDQFDLIRCTSVCKSWHYAVHRSDVLKMKFCEQQLDGRSLSEASSSSQVSVKNYMQEWAMKEQRLSLQSSSVDVDQWVGHSSRVRQCRLKMGLILTGVGDKVVRIWSLQSYKCLEEYSIPNVASLADFDFDENKIVGLLGTRICIWRRQGKRDIFPSHEGTFSRGLCMRYIDPEAVVGCEDGSTRIFDMYSKRCSQIIRMHTGPLTCLAVTDDQLILCGCSLGSIKVASVSSDRIVDSLTPFRFTDYLCLSSHLIGCLSMVLIWGRGRSGVSSLCFNSNSSLVFAGSTAGFVNCWDLRTMKPLWDNRISPNVIYSLQHLPSDTSSLAAGGIDGVLRVLDQNTGKILSSYVVDESTARASSNKSHSTKKKKAVKLAEGTSLDSIPKTMRPPITCLAVGMKKVVTTHNSNVIRVWKFNK
ncbi:hypothetical protein Syun_017568 [Stephania yunnanensis]|uniref:F-box domain-containing protein n=1 Tax=Stephania yunnanensis TaxID=152371 RepID=A0AAP0P5Z1_9MAGN